MSNGAIVRDQLLTYFSSICGTAHTGICCDTVAVAPANAREIAEVLRHANEQRLTVTLVGGGTKLRWGNPVSAQILLSLERLNAVREHSWHDMTCTVDAGCTWCAMQSALAQHGQMVALDPLWLERATVGGIAATNDSGALRLKYGGLRDLVLGMTLVLADGTIARTGGKVVKNVAGYDLHKLMIGSFGTLGVITEVNFRLHPVEEHVHSWTISARGPEELAAPLRALLDSQLVPSAVQLRSGERECALDVRIATRPECLNKSQTRLKNIFVGLICEETNDAVWNARQNLFLNPAAAVLKISVLPAEVCAMIADVQRWASTERAEIALVAQATGLIFAALPDGQHLAPKLIELLRQRFRKSAGSVVAFQIPEPLRGRTDVWGCESNALPLMGEIKRRFDPNRILNPGRFVGGI
jgi:glycolate oxidase FAD binding subunit